RLDVAEEPPARHLVAERVEREADGVEVVLDEVAPGEQGDDRPPPCMPQRLRSARPRRRDRGGRHVVAAAAAGAAPGAAAACIGFCHRYAPSVPGLPGRWSA